MLVQPVDQEQGFNVGDIILVPIQGLGRAIPEIATVIAHRRGDLLDKLVTDARPLVIELERLLADPLATGQAGDDHRPKVRRARHQALNRDPKRLLAGDLADRDLVAKHIGEVFQAGDRIPQNRRLARAKHDDADRGRVSHGHHIGRIVGVEGAGGDTVVSDDVKHCVSPSLGGWVA